MDYIFNNVARCIAFQRVVGCSYCSRFFAEPENFIGMCVDMLIDPNGTVMNIFQTVENVCRRNPSTYSALAIVNGPPEMLNMILNSLYNALNLNNVPDLAIPMTLAPVKCLDCDTRCGWEMVSVQYDPDYPKLNTGQFIIRGSLINEAVVRRAKKRRI